MRTLVLNSNWTDVNHIYHRPYILFTLMQPTWILFSTICSRIIDDLQCRLTRDLPHLLKIVQIAISYIRIQWNLHDLSYYIRMQESVCKHMSSWYIYACTACLHISPQQLLRNETGAPVTPSKQQVNGVLSSIHVDKNRSPWSWEALRWTGIFKARHPKRDSFKAAVNFLGYVSVGDALSCQVNDSESESNRESSHEDKYQCGQQNWLERREAENNSTKIAF